MPKKKSFKKRSKKPSSKGAESMAFVGDQSAIESSSATNSNDQVKASYSNPAMAYVTQDVRRIGVIVGSFITLQLILAYILNYTSLGVYIYGLIKV